jgi:nicotinate-nucleotide adenylyltransferase
MSIKKIGVIAGAFDPMHGGHLNFIHESIKKYSLDKVLILIEERSKHKPSFADFSHRKKIVELSIGNDPNIEIYQTRTASFPISSTLPELKTKYKARFYLLVGNDVGEHILSWPDSDDLLNGVELVVANRSEDNRHKRISSGKVRQQIKNKSNVVDMQKDALNYCLSKGLYK